jgi:hypothetical protein
MPDPNEEDDIFQEGSLPATQEQVPDREVAVPDSHADELVSSMISSMQREGGGPAARRYVPAQAEPSDSRQLQTRQQPGREQQQMPSEMQGVIAELREERRSRQALEKKIQELTNPRQPDVPFSQRVFEDPDNAIDGRVRQHIDPIAQQLQTFRTDMDFKVARMAHGEEFDHAYQAWFEQVGDPQRPDPQTYWAIMNSPSPGEALMEWHNNRQIQSEIGRGGLAAFRARIEREALERHGLAAPEPQAPARRNGNLHGAPAERDDTTGRFRPRHEVRLPTATSRMGHTSREAAYSPEDGSDEAIFDFGREKRK